jgi:hypothetical protein
VSGEVRLEGTVLDRYSKHRAEDLADSVSGVRDVSNNLRTRKGFLREMGDKLIGDDRSEHRGHSGSGTHNAPQQGSAAPQSSPQQNATTQNSSAAEARPRAVCPRNAEPRRATRAPTHAAPSRACGVGARLSMQGGPVSSLVALLGGAQLARTLAEGHGIGCLGVHRAEQLFEQSSVVNHAWRSASVSIWPERLASSSW